MGCQSLASVMIAATFAAVGTPPIAHLQGGTLMDRARAQGGKVFSTISLLPVSASLADVVTAADVVVRARIQSQESRLTSDGMFVRTFYAFTPSKTFKDTVGIKPTRRAPAMTIPLVFFETGGVLKTDGLEIHQSTNLAVDPPLTAGEDVFLMLHWNTDASAFGLRNAAYGVLRIHGDTVAEARKTIKRNLAGKRVNEVEAEIERLVAGLPRR